MIQPGVLRILRAAGILAALAFLGFAMRSAWREVAVQPVPFDVGTASLALALLALTYLGMVALWRALLAEVGAKTTYGQALQLWSFSNLGRYIPGKIWQMLGLVAFARDLGVAPGLAVASAVLALLLMVCTGAFVGLLLAPGVLSAGGLPSVGAALAAAALLAPVIRPSLVNGGLRRLPKGFGCGEIPELSRASVVRLVLWFSAAWVAHGLAFSVFASAFGSVAWPDVRLLSGTYALAYVVGLLAVFAPGGIGVREGVLAHLLGAGAGADLPVHVVAVASRLWVIVGELIVLGLAVGLRIRSRGRP